MNEMMCTPEEKRKQPVGGSPLEAARASQGFTREGIHHTSGNRTMTARIFGKET